MADALVSIARHPDRRFAGELVRETAWARNGLTDVRRRVRRLEAQAGVGRWRPNDWPIPDATIEGAIAVHREHVGLDVLRECLAAKPEDGDRRRDRRPV
jgi:hypothetical protein